MKDELNWGERYDEAPPAARRPESHKILDSKKCHQTDFLQSVYNLADGDRLASPGEYQHHEINSSRKNFVFPKITCGIDALTIQNNVFASPTQNY